ncbi:MAG: hypothetical protein SNH73_06705 [Rikenellaceae bacterium]
MKKYIILFAMILSFSSLQAQVNKEVEVTKAYIPTVSKAVKPVLEAQIVDTAYINPDVDYSITPLSISTQLQTQPIKPATVTYWEFNKPAMAQVKVGAGYPLNSLLQAYCSTHNASVGYLAAKVDHFGYYSDIKNVYGSSIDATQISNNVAVAAGLYIAGRTLSTDVCYSGNIYHNYAFEQTLSSFINNQSIGASVGYGDNFVDLSRFNYRVNLDYSHFYNSRSNIDDGVEIDALFGQEIGLGKLLFSLGYESISSDNMYQNNNASFAFSIDNNISGWVLSVGGQYYFDQTSTEFDDTPHHYVIPKLSIKRADASSLSLFADIGGSIEQNSYSKLAAINPYIGDGVANQSSVEYNFIGGVEGQLASSSLNYRLYCNYAIWVNNRYWALRVIDEPSDVDNGIYYSSFDLSLANLNTMSFNLDLNYKPFSNLALAADVHYYSYNESSSIEYINSNPDFEISLGADYTLRKLKVGVNGHILGERRFTVLNFSDSSNLTSTTSTMTLKSSFDLSAYAQWQASDSLSVFIEGGNLCSANLYPWPYYRGFGAQITAGVKINFK